MAKNTDLNKTAQSPLWRTRVACAFAKYLFHLTRHRRVLAMIWALAYLKTKTN